jgi:hypothetical protein
MKRSFDVRRVFAGAAIALGLATALPSLAEVRSCTLGIDTNCPSGLSE